MLLYNNSNNIIIANFSGFSYSQFVDFVYYATIASILLGGCSVVLAIWKQIFEYSSYGRNFIFSVFAMLLFLLSLVSICFIIYLNLSIYSF